MKVGGRSSAYLVGGLLTVRAPIAIYLRSAAFLVGLFAIAPRPQGAAAG